MNGSGKVWEAVEAFRRQYLARAGGVLPVDVFSLVELQLRLDVIPFDDLQAKYRIDAAKIKFGSFDHFARHFKGDDPARYWLEQEANEFAGRLLVPVERLREQFDQFARQIAVIMPGWLQSEDLRTKFAEQVAPRFGVHTQSILTRLDREGLWPAP